MGLDGWFHLASNQTNTVNNFGTIWPYDRGRGIEYDCVTGVESLSDRLLASNQIPITQSRHDNGIK